MRKTKTPWWPFVKNMITNYPIYHAELNEIRTSSVTAKYGKGGGRGKPGRKTEQTALRSLDKEKQRYHDTVEKALERTKYMPDGALRCRMVKFLYFDQLMNMHGAALALHVSYSTIRRWNAEFFRLVWGYWNGQKER